ncbi:hypothetical protein FACS1894120_5610 [Clostridia bacterium]|nr:hypothetical protein FACS1894120_5610 [Clostridia bacterium]
MDLLCGKCGAKVKSGAKFCGICGADIIAPVAAAVQTARVVQPAPDMPIQEQYIPQYEQTPRGSNKVVVVLGGAVCGAAVMCGVIFGLLPLLGFDNIRATEPVTEQEASVLKYDNNSVIPDESYAEMTSITIPYGVTSIGDGAFYDCSNLKSVTIPDSVTSIGEGAFGYCENLTGITIPDSVTSIGYGAFEGSGLTSVTIPDSVKSIGYRTFAHCESLKSVTIPDSVTSIGGEAFTYCESLTSITIPDSVISIVYSAFGDCDSMTSITLPRRFEDTDLYIPDTAVVRWT